MTQNFIRINQVYQYEYTPDIFIWGEIVNNKLHIQQQYITKNILNNCSKMKINIDKTGKPYVIYFKIKCYLSDFIKRTVLPQFRGIGTFTLEEKYFETIRKCG